MKRIVRKERIMGITVNASEKKFELPPQGMHQGVCVDVVDLGMVEDPKWQKTQHKCRVVFQLASKMEDGRPYIISRRFTVSLGEKSALRPFLETWRNKAFSAEELRSFDLDTLIGANGMVQILYNDEGETTYANLNAVM